MEHMLARGAPRGGHGASNAVCYAPRLSRSELPTPPSMPPPHVQARASTEASAIDAPRVLAILNMSTAWSRGVLRGFMAAAHQQHWTVLHSPPPADVEALVQRFKPAAILIGPDSGKVPFGGAGPVPIVSVALDLSAQGIPSVLPDEERIGV